MCPDKHYATRFCSTWIKQNHFSARSVKDYFPECFTLRAFLEIPLICIADDGTHE